jgi:hypothetical protein
MAEMLFFAFGLVCGYVLTRALLSERISTHWERFWYEFWRVQR